MKRVVALCFVVACVFAPPAARAQAPTNNLNARVAALEAAVAALQSGLVAEAGARAAADTSLQTNINSEAAARAAADTTLQNNINSEAGARAAADTSLDARSDKLEGNIVAGDLVGTYAVHLVGISMDPPGTVATFNEMSSYVFTGTATLAANGTGSLNGTVAGILMTEQAANLNWMNEGGSAAQGGNFLWSYNNGTLSTLVQPGVEFNDFNLSVAAGGQVLVSVAGGPPSNNQQLIVWTRVANP